LAGIYFFNDNLTKIGTVEDLTEKLKKIKGQPNINSTEEYTLSLDPAFDDFIVKEIGIVQNILMLKRKLKKNMQIQTGYQTTQTIG
jgi:hypothetical protein